MVCTARTSAPVQGRKRPVLGGTGAVGLAAIQIAKAMGARVLAGVSNPAKAPLALKAGCDDIIDLSKENLYDTIRQQVFAKNGGNGVDVVIDPIGGDAFDASLRALAWQGRLVVVGFASGRIPTVKTNYLLVKNIEISGLQVSDYRKRTPDLMTQCIQEIFTMFESGKISPAETLTCPLDSFAEALSENCGPPCELVASFSYQTRKLRRKGMPFRYDEIGNRLKAYRLGSGLSAEEIATQLGISRTALYRFEKGELAKIETIERLAELLGVSIPTLLGVGIEYIPSAVTYFERMRQIEETAEHIAMLSGPISFLLASDSFETTLEEVLTENVTKNVANRARALS